MGKQKTNGALKVVAGTPETQPISHVEWVDPETLHSNLYNPNTVFPQEMALLKESLISDGWTAAITATDDGEIVDGFHRWSLGLKDADVRTMTGGLVPVVRLRGKSLVQRMAATVRQNRARGQHGILKMSAIVLEMRKAGSTDAEIVKALGMESEEIDRLTDLRGSPEAAGKDSFGRGWVPDPKANKSKR